MIVRSVAEAKMLSVLVEDVDVVAAA